MNLFVGEHCSALFVAPPTEKRNACLRPAHRFAGKRGNFTEKNITEQARTS
ncbi:hypothetical protein McpSp1_12110 [Methanocorpusculaceae archaeon Sp1]|nr:hypothetical protein [Methanocorpusculaceae archaeon Sp1]